MKENVVLLATDDSAAEAVERKDSLIEAPREG
jgi:hypothetical protein